MVDGACESNDSLYCAWGRMECEKIWRFNAIFFTNFTLGLARQEACQ